VAHKVKKIAGIILTVLAVLIVILTCVFFFWLGPTVKAVAQHIGSKALGTPLTIQELEIKPHDGTFHLTGFTIANPEAFSRSNAVSLASMDIAIDMGSLLSPTVTVHRVQLESPHFVYEQDTAIDNISRLIENLEAFTGADGKEPKKQTDEADQKQKEPKRVIVEQLEINDIQFHLAHTVTTELDIDVRIEQLALSMTNGVAALQNLQISNPSRLETPNLFTLDRISIEMDPVSLYSGPLSIREVQVTRPYAYLENNAQTDTVTEFLHIADLFSTAPADPMPDPTPEAEISTQEPAAPVTVQLHKLTVDDMQVKLLDSTSTNAPAQTVTLAGIGSISAKLVEGLVQIDEIYIPNPAGYTAVHLFHLNGITIALDPDSLFSEQTQLTSIRIDSPLVNLEQTETGGNIADLQTQLNRFAPPSVATAEAAASAETEASTEPVRMEDLPVVLHELVVTNFAITLKMPVETNQATWSVGMADLGKLNPLSQLSLDPLNPLGDSEEQEEAEADPDAPMTLIDFQNLSIQPLKGMIDISELRIANPPKFTRRNLIQLESFHGEIDPASLQADTLLIKDIVLTRPRVRYERQLLSDNIKALQKEIEQATVTQSSEPVDAATTEEAENDGQKVIIERVVIAKSSVQAKLSIAPATPPIPLPTITLNDIGKEKGGATAAEASTQVIDTFYDTMINAVGETTGFAGDALKGFGALSFGSSDDETAEEESLENAPETQVTEPADETAEDEITETPKSRKRRHPGRAF
jgi:uncharacterized protein involved in outer membrane biogenesis